MSSRLPGWGDDLDSFHAQQPGITEDVLARGIDRDGASPYAWWGKLRFRLGVGDGQLPEIASLLAKRLGSLPGVEVVMRYTVGPSVGCHTGAGTVGAIYYAR